MAVVALRFAAGFAALPLLLCVAHAQEKPPATSPAATLVRCALEAGSAGDTAARREYLAQALSADPNDAASHWQHGDVRLNGQWRSVEQLARDPARIRKVNDYRARRRRRPIPFTTIRSWPIIVNASGSASRSSSILPTSYASVPIRPRRSRS